MAGQGSAFDERYEQAVEQGAIEERTEPRAVSARYDAGRHRIEVELRNGFMFGSPAELGEGLRGATPEQLARVEVLPGGYGLHWEELDADLAVPALVKGIFGTKAWMGELGRVGGSARSAAKAAAARANGRKGGRPRKTPIPGTGA